MKVEKNSFVNPIIMAKLNRLKEEVKKLEKDIDEDLEKAERKNDENSVLSLLDQINEKNEIKVNLNKLQVRDQGRCMKLNTGHLLCLEQIWTFKTILNNSYNILSVRKEKIYV